MPDTIQVLIGEDGPDLLTIDESATVSLNFRKFPAENNSVREKKFIGIVSGKLKKTGAELIFDRMKELYDEVVTGNTPRRFRVKVNSTTKIDWKPGEFVNSPLVIEVDLPTERGAKHQHQPFTITVEAKKGGTGGETTDVSNLDTSVSTTVRFSKTIEKRWRAFAQAKTLATAVSEVLSYKPPGSPKEFTHRLTKFKERSAAEAEWIWLARNRSKVREVRERISVVDMQEGWVFRPQKSSDPKVMAGGKFHRRVSYGTRVEIIGEVLGVDKSIKPPKPHFTETTNYRRMKHEETQNSFEPVFDEESGLWMVRFHEVWHSRFGRQGINHHDHGDITYIDPPSDGKIG